MLLTHVCKCHLNSWVILFSGPFEAFFVQQGLGVLLVALFLSLVPETKTQCKPRYPLVRGSSRK